MGAMSEETNEEMVPVYVDEIVIDLEKLASHLTRGGKAPRNDSPFYLVVPPSERLSDFRRDYLKTLVRSVNGLMGR